MYNPKYIEQFIDKVNEEAQKAAQAVFDKYQPELEKRISNQMVKGDKLYNGMGTCFIERKGENIYHIGEEFCKVLQRTQYPVLEANFTLPDFHKIG